MKPAPRLAPVPNLTTCASMLLLCVVAMIPSAAAANGPAKKAAAASCTDAAGCEKKCNEGNAAACARAGSLHLDGSKPDLSNALRLLQRGCDLKDAGACGQLGALYSEGKRVPADPARALVYDLHACDLGQTATCERLGVQNERAAPQISDPAKANLELARAAWCYQRACDGGSPMGCALAARLVYFGSGVAQDVAAATRLLTRACDGDVASACETLSYLQPQKAAELRKKADRGGAAAPLSIPALRTTSASELVIHSVPAGAPLRINGFFAGQTPVTLRVPAGEFLLELRPEASAPVTRVVKAEAGKRQTIQWDLPVPFTVSSTPSGADVVLDGAVVGQTPWKGAVVPGTHTLELRLARHQTISKSVQVAAARPAQESIALQLAPATLVVETDPPGATVHVNGVPVGKSPYQADLAPGEHAVRAVLEGHFPAEKKLTVVAGAGATHRFELKRSTAEISVTTEPAGAAVTIDGEQVGVTPYRAGIAPGAHEVKVELEGHLAQQKKLKVVAGKAAALAFALKSSTGKLAIQTEPSGAAVEVDGAAVGTTPYAGPIAIGARTIRVHLAGHLPVEKKVNVTSGQRVEQKLSLKRSDIRLAVESEPRGATVEVDGAPVGTTPYAGELAPGRHQVKVSLSGYAPVTRTVNARIGDQLVEKVKLSNNSARLVVESEPTGAQVTVDGAEAGVTPYEGEVEAGKHQIVVSLPGHAPVTRTVTARSGEAAVEKVKLASNTARLVIESQPPGAQVTIDGVQAGVTPYAGDVERGKRQVALTLSGHRTQTLTVLAFAGKEARKTITLKPDYVPLQIASEPSGAAVRVDGAVLGKTPFKGRVLSGPRTLELVLDGYATFSEKLDVPPQGKKVERQVKLSVAAIPLSVAVDPVGAEVYVGDQRVGVAPFEGSLAPGTHVVSARLQGFDSAQQEVKAVSGGAVTVSLKLVAQQVMVTIDSIPSGALLSVDGREVGPAPQLVPLTPGAHNVSATLPGHEPATLQTLLPAGAPVTWKLNLSPAMAESPMVEPPLLAPEASRDPKAVLDEAVAKLAHAAVTADEKRALVRELEGKYPDLTALIDAVQPEELRAELCQTWGSRVGFAYVAVATEDAFGDEVPGAVWVNGKLTGQVPFNGIVPACARQVAVVHGKSGERWEQDVKLSPNANHRLLAKFPGRPPLTAWTLTGDTMAWQSDWGDGQVRYYAAGLRVDYYGKFFYSSYAVKAGALGLRGAQPELLQFPLADASFGVAATAGEGQIGRLHLAAGLGVANLILPTARLSLGLNIADRVYLSAAGQAHMHPLGFVPPEDRQRPYSTHDLNDFFFFSGSVSVGLMFGR